LLTLTTDAALSLKSFWNYLASSFSSRNSLF
jgi:hypothetical protein